MLSILAVLLLYVSPQEIQFVAIGGSLGEPIFSENIVFYSDEEFITPNQVANKMIDQHGGCEYFDVYIQVGKNYNPIGKWRKKNGVWFNKTNKSSRWYLFTENEQ